MGCASQFAKEPNNYIDKLVDPVSGKEFNVTADGPKATYKSNTYYFESDATKAEFEKDPAKYAKLVLQ